ncbi:ABC transporter F family member 3-like [Henckelia pumila]|uniref:ABC transporter F family member 3-like n=1 Tax=Henckelia pumila TaxID=405737 RepID=UPI003C6DCCBB
MDEEKEAPKKKPEPVDGPLLTEHDKMKIERRKRKEERQREDFLLSFRTHESALFLIFTFFSSCTISNTLRGNGSSLSRHAFCLVGRNGTGKTTFLRYMAMHDIEGIPKNCQILHVEQEVVGDDISALQCHKATKTFSGGWRMRIALARALSIKPDLSLLDKPTNHLDLHVVLWLESYLVKWPKIFIVVSHAREFLNTVVTDILHLQGQQLTAYRGNYDTFERTREEQLKNQQKAFESNERARSHMQSFIDKFRYNAKRASLIQSRIKVL